MQKLLRLLHVEYKEKHGDCIVPRCYEPNKPLGQWVDYQRYQYRLLQQGKKSEMRPERIDKLEEIGFVWDASYLRGGQSYANTWNQKYKELIDYEQKHGHYLVSKTDEQTKQLGKWVSNQRTQYRLLQEGKKTHMTTERIDKLEKIGFKWKADNDTWKRRYKELIEYKEKHGDCNVPQKYKSNMQLGSWVHYQRKHYRLLQQGKKSDITPGRIEKLEKIGFLWDASHLAASHPDNDTWNQRYKELIEYKQKHGNCDVPRGYGPNKQLGSWVMTQRRQHRLLQKGGKSQITQERIAKLEKIGFKWKARG